MVRDKTGQTAHNKVLRDFKSKFAIVNFLDMLLACAQFRLNNMSGSDGICEYAQKA